MTSHRASKHIALQERLTEMIILALHENGEREYKTMTVRQLYSYVMSAITTGKNTNTYNPKSARSLVFNKKRQESVDLSNKEEENKVTYRERLGGYLHPRDMRRLVSPFSNTNEPALIVRRHVMLLNFDPLRAIVLRDRLLLLVPDGADSLLMDLEKRMQGLDYFDDVTTTKGSLSIRNSSAESLKSQNEVLNVDEVRENFHNETSEFMINDEDDEFDNEFEDINRMKWSKVNFELLSVDCVMQSVMNMLSSDARELVDATNECIGRLRGVDGMGVKVKQTESLDYAQDKLRSLKDEVKSMEGRVQGFVRALNLILDEDEDLALMNLSRLISHPERFIQPVSEEILHEESDEPELILEAYVQQGLSVVNALDNLKGKILTTEELVALQLDTIRNRLLYINTFVSLVSASIAATSMVGSIFGMNLKNFLEDDETAFMKVTIGSVLGGFFFLAVLTFVFLRVNNAIPSSSTGLKV